MFNIVHIIFIFNISIYFICAHHIVERKYNGKNRISGHPSHFLVPKSNLECCNILDEKELHVRECYIITKVNIYYKNLIEMEH